MAEFSAGSPVFADRYRFQTVGNDWDLGRSGFTHLVFDIKKERLGVIKRAEIKSQQQVDGLKNEVAVLLDLKGLGVPEVYDTGETEYGSKNYYYMVIEYIDGIRIEKYLDSLPAPDRAEILTQFFDLLANSHRIGIVNGDIDLKHLFWRRDRRKLIVIDWGSAISDINPKKKAEFAYDLARSAEIIYSLTTLKGHPPATGSIALPNDSFLITRLAPIPTEFRALCKWAPRTPNEGALSPYTAQELFVASKAWQKAVQSSKPYKPGKRPNWGLRLIFGLIIIIMAIFLGIVLPASPFHSLFYTTTVTSIVIASNTTSPTVSEAIVPSDIPLSHATVINTATQAVESTFTQTTTAAVTPSPATYVNQLVVFNKESLFPSNCWVNTPFELKPGFDRREDGNWQFGLRKGRTTDQFIQTDFSQCFEVQKIKALAINIWVPRLELQRDSPENPGTLEAGKEFGFFIETADGRRREYTIWIDINKLMHLQIRENSEITLDEIVLIVNEENLKIRGTFPRLYAEFPIQIFFEINNNELDILYLRQGPILEAVKAEDMDPSQMIINHHAVRPTLAGIQNIGLIGYGGDTQTIIWPLVFLGE